MIAHARPAIVAGAAALALAATLLPAAPAYAVAAWRPETTVSDPGGSAVRPQVASNAAGDVAAVWEAGGVVQASFHTAAGGAWSPPVRVSPAGGAASQPDVAVDGAGNAVAVWLLVVKGKHVVQSASAPPGGPWSAPEAISVTGQEAGDPRVAVNASGDATAVWDVAFTFSPAVQSARRPPGGSWQAPVSFSHVDGSFDPDIAVDSAGRATMTWVTSGGGHTWVQAATRSLSGVWSLDVDLSLDTTNVRQPRVVLDAAGNAMVIWTRFNMVVYVVQAAVHTVDGAWSNYMPISAGDEEANGAEVALAPNGDATAVWYAVRSGKTVVETASRPAGGAWSTWSDLSDTATSAVDPHVVVDQAGTATAIWSQASTQVRASRRPAGGAWTSAEPVSSTAPETVTLQLAGAAAGDAAAMWVARNGGTYEVRAAGLDTSGPAVALSVPAKATAGEPAGISASVTDAWSQVTSYAWSFGDGATASTPSPTHSFAKPGSYQVSLTATDAVGNSTTRTATVSVTLPVPRIRFLRLTDPTIAKGETTRLKIGLTTAATVKLVLKGKGTGTKARLSKKLPKGTSRVKLTTKVGGKVLPPDSYVITATATNASGTSKKKSVVLKVVR